MSMTVSTKLTQEQLAEIEASMPGRIDQFVRLVGADLMGYAKVESPVRTGFLRNSIDMVQEGAGVYRVTAAASYAAYVHDGTRFQAPNPYMSRARLIVIVKWNADGFQLA